MEQIRLIDADALKASFDERYDSAFMQMHTRYNKEYCNGVCTGVNWGRNIITDMPTVDAVKVVRCRECRYFVETKGKDSGKPCGYGKCNDKFGRSGIAFANDFCSYGERRNSEKNN